MKKNITKILLIILFTLLSFVIQLCFLNNVKVFGIKINIVLVCVTIACLALKSNITIPYAFGVGIVMDVCFKFTIGPSTLSFLLIALAITIIKDTYNKYHVGFLFVVMMLSTFVYEAISYVDSMIQAKAYINVFLLFWVVIKSGIIHFVIAYVIKMCSNKLEHKYRQDAVWKKGMSEYRL